MKKIMLMVAIIATMLVISCTPKQASVSYGNGDTTYVDSVITVDSLVIDSTMLNHSETK